MGASDYLYDIELLRFESLDRDAAVSALATAFGIPSDHAAKMVDRVPVRVRSDANAEEAERYIRTLLAIGAEVRVENGPNERIYRPQDLAPARASSPEPEPAEPDPAPVLERAVCPQCGLEQGKCETCERCGAALEFDPYELVRSHTQSLPSISNEMIPVTPPGASPAVAAASVPPPRASDLFQRSTVGAAPFVLSLSSDDGLFNNRRNFDPRGMVYGRVGSGAFLSVATGSHPTASVSAVPER